MFVGQEQLALLPIAMGFTAAGVAACSVAAATQSAVYGGYVASSSAFALAQSVRGRWNWHERCCWSLLGRSRRNFLCEE